MHAEVPLALHSYFVTIYCLFAHLLIGGSRNHSNRPPIFITIRIIDIDYSCVSIRSVMPNAARCRVTSVFHASGSIPRTRITGRSKVRSSRNRPGGWPSSALTRRRYREFRSVRSWALLRHVCFRDMGRR